MSWYSGQTVLSFLESVPIIHPELKEEFYFSVQYVIRPDLSFRGYSGIVGAGKIKVGDAVMIYPSGLRSTVSSIHTWNSKIDEAFAGQSLTISLQDEIDISRGDVLVLPENKYELSHEIEAGHCLDA